MAGRRRDELTFSQAEGLDPLPRPLRLGELPNELRNDIFNALMESLSASVTADFIYDEKKTIEDPWLRLLALKHTKFDHRPIDEFNPDLDEVVAELKTFILRQPYNRVLDLLQFLVRNDEHSGLAHPLAGVPAYLLEKLTAVCEEHQAAYRFVGTTITPIATEEEVAVLKKAFADLATAEFGGARAQLRAAAEALSRPEGARDAIREAVHAVESVARVLTGNPKATLSDALGVLKKKERIHPALEAAFQKLYAYTNDEHGLRHALNKEEADVDEGDAMYMVGSCAGFVTYLIGKARKYRLPPVER